MALSFKATRLSVAGRPAARQIVKPRVASVVLRATPDKTAVETAIKEAEAACADSKNTGECAAAWDNVEEISAAVSHKKQQEVKDPLEQYCEGNPSEDECRVYDE